MFFYLLIIFFPLCIVRVVSLKSVSYIKNYVIKLLSQTSVTVKYVTEIPESDHGSVFHRMLSII